MIYDRKIVAVLFLVWGCLNGVAALVTYLTPDTIQTLTTIYESTRLAIAIWIFFMAWYYWTAKTQKETI